MNEHPATLLRCVVERITYQNPENGYSVLKVKVKGYSDLVTLVGNLLEVPVGSVLLCRGEWKVDKCYGSQFVAATWEETMPATVYGIEKYLGSGLVKGIGPRFARAIVQRFGTETIDIIETEIESGASASRPPTASPQRWAMRKRTRDGAGAASSIRWDNFRTKDMSTPGRNSW